MTGARIGDFEDLMAGVDVGVQSIALRLRALILSVDPQAVEVVRLGDRAATYGVGPRKMTEGYAYIMPQRGYVNLGLYRGARLSDPAGLLEGTGKALRHVKVRTVDEADRPALRGLIVAAVTERRSAVRRE